MSREPPAAPHRNLARYAAGSFAGERGGHPAAGPTVTVLPSLSDPDPEVAGEGSLDPLGLAAFADRLADLLAPDVRARMSRLRFVTAITVGAVVAQELWDEPAGDGVSTPPICFEWVVLEAFVRKAKVTGALDATGVPGSAKAHAVIAQGKRLTAANYLKAPSVFGFNGVYQPLARGLRVVDDERMPAERAVPLVAAWETEQGFGGFLDRRPGSEGSGLRDRLTNAVRDSIRAGRCTAAPSAHLWIQLARSLPPLAAGIKERALLRGWLLDPEQLIRRELAAALGGRSWLGEAGLLEAIAPNASPQLRERIDAVAAYERFCGRLDAAFATLRHISTTQGSQPLTPASCAGNSVLAKAARELPDAYARLTGALGPIGLEVRVEADLGIFGESRPPSELAEVVLDHHRRVQHGKRKREWFEEYGDGLVVRSLYRQGNPVGIDDSTFLHPFRIGALWQFMEDTRP